jgi:DNA-binding NarL/FixJ family response regulator
VTERGQVVLATLTPKERAVVQQVCTGHSNREIAENLATTEQVIKNYMRGILDKTGMGDRLELAIYCFYHGIVQCPCGGHVKAA